MKKPWASAQEIVNSVSIPVMAKCRIGHFVESQALIFGMRVRPVALCTKAPEVSINGRGWERPVLLHSSTRPSASNASSHSMLGSWCLEQQTE